MRANFFIRDLTVSLLRNFKLCNKNRRAISNDKVISGDKNYKLFLEKITKFLIIEMSSVSSWLVSNDSRNLKGSWDLLFLFRSTTLIYFFVFFPFCFVIYLIQYKLNIFAALLLFVDLLADFLQKSQQPGSLDKKKGGKFSHIGSKSIQACFK